MFVEEDGVILTEKQKLFCDLYLLTMNGTRAAKQAGYSENSAREIATENLAKPAIKAYLKKRRKEKEELLKMNFFTQAQALSRIAQKAEAKEAVTRYNPATKEIEEVVDKEGKTVYQFDSNGAVKALEQLNKMFGYNEPTRLANKDGGDLFEKLKEVKIKFEDGSKEDDSKTDDSKEDD